MASRSNFRQSDITRALKAARAAGFEVTRVEIHPDGNISLSIEKDHRSNESTAAYDWRAHSPLYNPALVSGLGKKRKK